MRAYFDAPMGWLEILAGKDKLLAIKHCKKPSAQELASSNRTRGVSGNDSDTSSVILALAIKQLMEYFQGDRKDFDLPLDISTGTSFQQSVWQALQQIPYGKTISYGELAASIGNPNASRAVGSANGKNPFCIVIPCHRVIAADGKPGGYTGGLDRKHWLLNHEHPEMRSEEISRKTG